jgi:hypothetical protein
LNVARNADISIVTGDLAIWRMVINRTALLLMYR